jgi:hypothetical protein
MFNIFEGFVEFQVCYHRFEDWDYSFHVVFASTGDKTQLQRGVDPSSVRTGPVWAGLVLTQDWPTRPRWSHSTGPVDQPNRQAWTGPGGILHIKYQSQTVGQYSSPRPLVNIVVFVLLI